MEIRIDGDIKEISKISQQRYNVAQINSISVKHKELRNKSKSPTFALT